MHFSPENQILEKSKNYVTFCCFSDDHYFWCRCLSRISEQCDVCIPFGSSNLRGYRRHLYVLFAGALVFCSHRNICILLHHSGELY